MKLKKEFLVHLDAPEALLVPTGAAQFAGLVRGNATFGHILRLLSSDTDEAAIVAALSAQFDAPTGKIEEDVLRAIAALREIGALDE